MKYDEILAYFEKEPNDLMYKLEDGEFIEVRKDSYREMNALGDLVCWILERRAHTRDLSWKQKRKINNRLMRFFKNRCKKEFTSGD